MSQLGYMVMACGIGAYTAGMFHLLTHGVFKALLFLAAGSVIHAMAAEQDIRRMGQVKRYMPTTYWTMLWGSLALAGIFPFAGFFSKDEILWQAWNVGLFGKGLWLIGVVVAFMTAFYTFRVFFMVFYGDDNVAEETKHHAHESPKTITIPLVTLAVGALLVGWLGQPFAGKNYVHEFLGPVFHSTVSGQPALHAGSFDGGSLIAEAVAADEEHLSPHGEESADAVHGQGDASGNHGMPAQPMAETHGAAGGHGGHDKTAEFLLMGFSLLVAAAGVFTAYKLYYRKSEVPAKIAHSYQGLYQASLNKWYWDELYDAVFVRPTLKIADGLWRIADEIIIDKVLVDGVAITTRVGGEVLKFFQTGRVQHYAMVMSLGIFVIVGGFFLF
jgi:NADH-quinone oxidoreductase subunit L